MRDEDLSEYRDNPDHDGGIRTAVGAWFADPAAAKARYGPIASWNVSNMRVMAFMFQGATSFNGDLSRWNVSSVAYMDGMFQGATSFNGDLSRWNVSSMVYTNRMFQGATSFNGDLSRWDVGQVKAMDGMFFGATSFTRELGGAWATSTARKLRMFHNSPGTIAGKTKAADGTIV